MTEINIKYRKQPIENADSELPYINLSFSANLPVIKIYIIIFLILAILIPFLPPKHYRANWHIPRSFGDYWEQMKIVFYLFATVVALVIIKDILLNIRTFIDRRLGHKKIAVFKVISIWNLFTVKVVFLNNMHFFTLKQKEKGFDEIEVGKIIEIKRTATHRFINYQIMKE